MEGVSKQILKYFDCVEDLLEKIPDLELYAYDINTVMKTEDIEFATGCMHIVKCEKGILKVQDCYNNDWCNVYMTRSYLNSKYLRIQ